MKQYYATALVCILALGGVIFYTYFDKDSVHRAADDMGSYAYLCTDGVEIKMVPDSDMTSITLVPGSTARFEQTTLVQAGPHNRFEGSGIVLTGAGESIRIITGTQTLDCNPVASQDMAPFNFGDAGEGAGVGQDAMIAVTANIAGKWQSIEDPRFVREFNADGTGTDSYDGERDAAGTWKVFSKDKPLVVAFEMQPGSVYVQMTIGGSSQDVLNFRVNKLTPESLELTYMERGNTLSFVRIQ